MSTAQARRQEKLQHPQDLLKMSKDLQESNTTVGWDDGGKIGNINSN